MTLLYCSNSLCCQRMDLGIHLSTSSTCGILICASAVTHFCGVTGWLQYQGFHICWAGFMLEAVIVVHLFMTLVYNLCIIFKCVNMLLC
jgi:hypothetical protein